MKKTPLLDSFIQERVETDCKDSTEEVKDIYAEALENKIKNIIKEAIENLKDKNE